MLLTDIVFKEGNTLLNKDLNTLLNDNFGNEFHLTKDFSDPNYFSIQAYYQNNLIGFCSGKININKTENENLEEGNFIKNGLIDLICVKKQFRKLGIGSILFKKIENKLFILGSEQIILFHWVQKSAPYPTIAIKNGFKFQQTIPNYWEKESIKQNYSCIKCGTPPCKCSCAVYVKNLRS